MLDSYFCEYMGRKRNREQNLFAAIMREISLFNALQYILHIIFLAAAAATMG